jgi:hypothetical protein
MGYLGYKPADKPLTAADITDSIITSAKIVDGTIVNADINASSAIAISKISATGTSEQVLRMNTGATALEFATASSGGMTLLSTTTLSGTSTSISITATGYIKLLVFGYGLNASSSVDDTYIRFNSDSGTNYKFTRINGDNSNSSGQSTQKVSTGIFVNMNGVYGYSSGGNISFYAEIYDPTDTTHYKNVLVNAVGDYSTGQNIQLVSGAYTANTAITSMQINSSSTLTAGTIKIYGVK